jgi:pilus assembly protein CpaD
MSKRITITTTAALLAVIISGCSFYDRQRLEGSDRSTVSDRYPIGAELQRAKLDVSGFTGFGPESSTAYFDTVRFVRAYAQEGRGPLRIATPRHGAVRDVQMVRRVVHAHGLASNQVRFEHRRDGAPGVTLSYDRIAAVAPDDCYDQSALSVRRPEQDVGTAFGCASQRNLAKMVADPSDLVIAAPEPDRGSERRAVLHKDWREHVTKAAQ